MGQETRKEKAVNLFLEGYNCSQSVFVAFADLYGLDRETALKLSASFGGGMGRMREVCGTVSGMLMVAGMETGAVEGKDIQGKKRNYDIVQALAGEFRKRNGSIYCKELLGLVPKAADMEKDARAEDVPSQTVAFTDTRPEERTEEYYKKRPCLALIQDAVDILETVLFRDDVL